MYAIKKFVVDDFFNLFDIMKKLNMGEIVDCFECKDVVRMMKNKKAIEEVGGKVALKILGIVLKNIGDCRTEVYRFVGGMTGLSSEEVGRMTPSELFSVITAILKTDEFKEICDATMNAMG